jgi:hypothetical protein
VLLVLFPQLSPTNAVMSNQKRYSIKHTPTNRFVWSGDLYPLGPQWMLGLCLDGLGGVLEGLDSSCASEYSTMYTDSTVLTLTRHRRRTSMLAERYSLLL